MTDPADPWALLEAASTVLTVHAHPDDETLSTGTLLAHLAARGARVVLLTATRGEEGETIPGSTPAGDTRSFVEVRADELDGAADALGVAERLTLGTAPALAAGAAPRDYRDSGMRWVTPDQAGPAEHTGPDALTRRPSERAIADLVAAVEAVRPEVLVSYDAGGTYGHPDHVRAHHITAAAARRSGVAFVEVASYHDGDPGAEDPSFVWRDLPETLDAVATALSCHRTQLEVQGRIPGAIEVRMSGGQVRAVPSRTGIRVHER